jgi:hypothetical protein
MIVRGVLSDRDQPVLVRFFKALTGESLEKRRLNDDADPRAERWRWAADDIRGISELPEFPQWLECGDGFRNAQSMGR